MGFNSGFKGLNHTIFLSSVFLRTQRNAFYAMLDFYGMGD